MAFKKCRGYIYVFFNNTAFLLPKNKDKYFVSFTHGDVEFQRVEINFDIYSALFELNKRDRNLTRSDERNLEHSELIDEILIRRVFEKPKGIEEITLEKETRRKNKKVLNLDFKNRL